MSPTLSVMAVGVILRTAATGLRHVHAARYLHRDIKPSNILVSDEGHANLADLGLAIRLRPDKELGYSIVPPQRAGSLDYMSPEQRLGNVRLTYTSDLYSLGKVGMNALGWAKTENDGRERRLRKRLLAVCQKACTEQREKRYQSAEDFEAEVTRCMADREPRVSAAYRIRTFPGRHRGLCLLLVLVIVIGALWTNIANWMRFQNASTRYPEFTALLHHKQALVKRGARTERIELDPLRPNHLKLLPADQGFEILEDSRFFDLENPGKPDVCFHTRVITLQRRSESARWFRVRIQTSGIAVHSECVSHNYTIAVGYDASLNTHQMSEVEELNIDTEAPLAKQGQSGPIQVVLHATYWGAFSWPDQFWAGMRVLEGTRRAQLGVRIGYPHKFAGIRLVTGQENESHEYEVQSTADSFEPHFNIPSPKPLIYKLRWRETPPAWFEF